MSQAEKRPLEDMIPIAKDVARMLASACVKLEICGSIRRRKPMVGDVEVIAIPKIFPEGNALLWLTDVLVSEGTLQKTEYPNKDKVSYKWGNFYRSIVYKGVRVDLFMGDENSFGFDYWLRTGPSDGNTQLVSLLNLMNAPFGVRDGYIYWGGERTSTPKKNDPKKVDWKYSGGQLLKIADEQTWFDLLGIAFVPPVQRVDGMYKPLLRHPDHQWGQLKEAWLAEANKPVVDDAPVAMKQGTLFDLNALVMEHKYGGKASKETPILRHWEAPFLHDGKVWVCVTRPSTSSPYGEWLLYHPEAPQAQKYFECFVKRSDDTTYYGEWQNLKLWLRAETVKQYDEWQNRKRDVFVNQVLNDVVKMLRSENEREMAHV